MPPTHPDWRAARTFADLCELGARFIGGGPIGFPGWLPGELDDESEKGDRRASLRLLT